MICTQKSLILQAGGYMSPAAEARKPEWKGTMSVLTQVSEEGLKHFPQVVIHR